MSSRAVRVDNEKLQLAVAAVRRRRFPTAPAVPLSEVLGSGLDLLTAVYDGALVAAPAEQIAEETKSYAARSMQDGFKSLGLNATVEVDGDRFIITRHWPVGTLPNIGRATDSSEIN